MCDYGMAELQGTSHWGKTPISACPKGGKHGPDTGNTVITKPGVTGYFHRICTACGKEGTCTE